MNRISPPTHVALVAALAMMALMVVNNAAGAASMRVTMACANDYFAYCSRHDPDSPGVRACFRANGARLTKGCVDALVAAGEVSKTEVRRRAASNR
jgi:hypothetical protein